MSVHRISIKSSRPSPFNARFQLGTQGKQPPAAPKRDAGRPPYAPDMVHHLLLSGQRHGDKHED